MIASLADMRGGLLALAVIVWLLYACLVLILRE